MANVLTLKNIKKTYGTVVKTEVLHGIDLHVDDNAFMSIIGQSGSGKSTLLNIMGTLDTPTEGDVFIYGKDTSKMNKNALAKLRNETLGFIFQYHYLLPEFTALENILMPYRMQHAKVSKAIHDYALELIDLVGLTEVKDNLATEMSGGQMQRVAIARALINKPKIILADEPTGSLDSDTTDKVYSLLRKIHKTYQTTFIIITHNKDIAEKTDRMIELTDGNISLDIDLT
ncbi:MAG: ABC transporter ATP-binding protein [Bacillota bacterium]